MRVYLVRHGETLFNKKGLAQGWSDSPLTEDGIRQAEDLRRGLWDVPFAAGYCSDLGRARETAAHILRGRDVPLQMTMYLREMNFGWIEGRNMHKIDERWHDRYYIGFREYGGEIWEDPAERMLEAFRMMALDHRSDTVLAVSHGWAIRSFLRTVDRPRTDVYYALGNINPNCSVTVFTYDNGEYRLEKFLDLSFVEKGRKMREAA